ncbi:MAG: ATP-binding cassette domain-containing protein [Solirubrobacteraceae bacterium]
MTAIEATGLVKTYPGDVRALDGLDLAVGTGTIFGLLGPNGAGKSTAVKVLTTLSRADAGSAHVAGFDVRRQAGQVQRAIGVVAQGSGVDRELTGRENLRLQARLYRRRGRDVDARIDELLEKLRLADVAERIARTYSGGMERRLNIAISLVHRPSVLFLDEPTTGLDPEVRAEMWEEIERLRDEEGLTILLTTHYLEEADRLASELAIIDRGRVVAAGSPDALKAQLHGDAIHIELRDPERGDAVRTALAEVAGVAVRDISIEGRAVHARVDDGASAVPAVLRALDAARVGVASVTMARPSLDDVYLRVAGRSFALADADSAHRDQEAIAV